MENEKIEASVETTKGAVVKKKHHEMSGLGLKQALEEKEKLFNGKDDIFGMTLLTNPGYISSARNIMFTSHLRQLVNLTNPDFPKVFTNYENIVGKNSTGYYEAKNDMEVVARIPKFGKDNEMHLYLLFLYDRKNDKYSVIEKRIVENLTEKFGYEYNNSNLDSKEVGSKVKKGEWLYKSSSYDDDNNYCYGKNVRFAYMLENYTIEDAIIVSESTAKNMTSKEVETFKVPLNDNDILCNIYGTNDEYKSFPDIGEYIVNKILCVKRRIHNDQLLFDLKKSNLRKINFNSDTLSYAEGRVVDIDIYCNKPLEELEANSFNSQLIKYIKYQKEFYSNVLEVCQKIKDSGSDYTNDISFYLGKARDILDDNVKWREEDNSVFGNIVIEFLVERTVGLAVGQKITGRYGNKGVISKIVPDEEMPFLETGERVDVIFNSLGVINRLNSFQLIEQSINFICNRTRDKLKTLSTMEEKEKLLFKLIGMFNEKQEKRMYKLYMGLTSSAKEEFFKSIYENGIYINIPPMWEEEPIFDKLSRIYDEFDWIKPYDVYVNKFGRRIKVLKPLIVGEMYVIKLKQTSKKGFSARSAGNLSMRGVPEKSNKSKDLYSKTPVRVGIDENFNSMIGVSPETLASMHLFYRTSVVGRRALGEELIENIDDINKFKYSHDYKNRNAEIFKAYLKCMGLKLDFHDNYTIKVNDETMKSFVDSRGLHICSDIDYEDIVAMQEIEDELENNGCFVGTPDELKEFKENKLREKKREKECFVISIDV